MLSEKKESNGRLVYSEGKVGMCQNAQLLGRVLTSEVGRSWWEAGFSCTLILNAQLKLALATLPSPASFWRRRLFLLLLLAGALLKPCWTLAKGS